MLIHAAERGYNLGSITSSLIKLLELYGTAELAVAIEEALTRNSPHDNTVRLVLEKRREEQQKFPPINIALPDDKRVRNLAVRPHNLKDYDQLQSTTE